MSRELKLVAAAALVLCSAMTRAEDRMPPPAVGGTPKVWQPITLTIEGPTSAEDATPNPFTDYRMTVTFTKGDRKVVVPGYFAADGNAGETGATKGSKWRAHFVPDEPGVWSYKAEVFAGEGIATAPITPEPAKKRVIRYAGTFKIGPADPKAPGFLGKGMLRYVGKHYLQFAGSKEYYIKGGADSPENFLGYWEFDGAKAARGLHRYGPHVGHWRPALHSSRAFCV